MIEAIFDRGRRRIFYVLILLTASTLVCGCRFLSNAAVLSCNRGGVIVDYSDRNNYYELQLGVPDFPIINKEVFISVDGKIYSWNDAIYLDGIHNQNVYGKCSLGPHYFGEYPKGMKRYQFGGIHLLVLNEELYGIWVQRSSCFRKDGIKIIIDGKDLRGLSLNEAKGLFGKGVKFNEEAFLMGAGL
jgi:hypothetical protein